jgi:hypothetical protein
MVISPNSGGLPDRDLAEFNPNHGAGGKFARGSGSTTPRYNTGDRIMKARPPKPTRFAGFKAKVKRFLTADGQD